MSRYPVDERGIARPVQEMGFESVEWERRKTNNHHRQEPRVEYQRSQIAHWVRGLVPHVETMWIPEHSRLHNQFKPPVMPSNSQMIYVLDEYMFTHGVLDVVCERATNQIYQVNQEQYEKVRNGTILREQ